MFTGTAIHSALAVVLAAALSGCGGGDSQTSLHVASPAPGGAAAVAAAPPLFDDDGRPRLTEPRLRPTDASARTHRGLYASREQLEWQQLIAGPYTVLVDVDVPGSVEAALQLAAQAQSRPDMGSSAQRQSLAFFVQAREPARAAAVADRLSASGLEAVFVVW